ncbi:MAG: hypothetical protein U0798_04385 [Gemmataceae bacterium]
MTPNAASQSDPPPSRVDALRLAVAVLPAVAAATPPAKGFLAALALIPRMYADPRYRVSPLGRIGPIVTLAAIVVNFAFWNYLLPIPLVALVAERVVIAALAIGLYLIFAREIPRYQKVLDYLAKYG